MNIVSYKQIHPLPHRKLLLNQIHTRNADFGKKTDNYIKRIYTDNYIKRIYSYTLTS